MDFPLPTSQFEQSSALTLGRAVIIETLALTLVSCFNISKVTNLTPPVPPSKSVSGVQLLSAHFIDEQTKTRGLNKHAQGHLAK